MLRAVALVCVVAVSGCSVALQKKPSSGKVATSECTTSEAFAIIDTTLTVVAVAASIYGLSRVDKTGDAIGMPAGFVAVPLFASAHNGYKWASQCRDNRYGAPNTETPVAAR